MAISGVGASHALAAASVPPAARADRLGPLENSAKTPPKPSPVSKSELALAVDERLQGLNKVVFRLLDPATKDAIAQIPPEWQIDLSVKLRALSAKIFGQ